MHIPFFDLTRQLQSWPELNETVRQVMERGQFIGGEPVQQFEKNFAKRLNIPYCIGTANGTDALYLILKALQLPAGSEIITPAWSCMPTAETIVLAGHQPVFCDVDDDYMVLTPETVECKITSRTRAVIAVHLYGQAAPVHQLKQLCEAHHIHLIEDCAQAHLTLEDGKPVGTFGAAAAFSFYPTKNLGALGDAGCVITANAELALRIRMLANHGSPPPEQYDYQSTGINSRLDTIQAALLNVKLTRLDELNRKRRSIAERYNYLLSELNEIRLPRERANTCHTWHIYCIRSGRRDALREHLSRNGVGSHIHYPVALPFTPAFAYLKHSVADFPVAAQLA
ncbi:MAG: DegT/DnrJ/EryC1/StrS family aminotransferase, partial [Cyclobacteriaceae bacterium]|nr:DegT/DnrJ/EryC1/StrS family aminotransferase [Cyclobacteriaceae bacterium]